MATDWAIENNKRWAFTNSNAGSNYFTDYKDLSDLNEVDWNAVQANQWSGHFKEGKQAEFLIEHSFPWELVEMIGVSNIVLKHVANAVSQGQHHPQIQVRSDWYY